MANLPRIAALARFHGFVAFIWLWRWLFWRLTLARPSFVHDLLASSRLRSPDSDASGGWAECLRGGGSQAWLRFPVLPRGHWLLNLAYVFCAGLVNLFLGVLVRSLPSCPRGGGVRACKRVCAHEHRHGRREGVSFTVKIPITLMPVASIVYGSCPSTQHRSLSVTPPRPPWRAYGALPSATN